LLLPYWVWLRSPAPMTKTRSQPALRLRRHNVRRRKRRVRLLSHRNHRQRCMRRRYPTRTTRRRVPTTTRLRARRQPLSSRVVDPLATTAIKGEQRTAIVVPGTERRSTDRLARESGPGNRGIRATGRIQPGRVLEPGTTHLHGRITRLDLRERPRRALLIVQLPATSESSATSEWLSTAPGMCGRFTAAAWRFIGR
jgi:hypothetical protein